MARPKSADPKIALTIRLPASVIARLGDNPRATLEALILARDARLTVPAKRPSPPAPHTGRVVRQSGVNTKGDTSPQFKSRLKGEWKAP